MPGSGDVRLDFDANSTELLVCDVIPTPPDTSFLRRARQAGATTVDGRGMLLEQAAINIKLWTVSIQTGRLWEVLWTRRSPIGRIRNT